MTLDGETAAEGGVTADGAGDEEADPDTECMPNDATGEDAMPTHCPEPTDPAEEEEGTVPRAAEPGAAEPMGEESEEEYEPCVGRPPDEQDAENAEAINSEDTEFTQNEERAIAQLLQEK